MKQFKCCVCSKTKPTGENFGTGYGVDKENKKTCYDCCAIIDKEKRRNDERL